MRSLAVTAFGLSLSLASPAHAQVRLAYETYAAGVEVMEMQVAFALGPWTYQIDLDFHTTGLVGLLFRGQQVNSVRGVWHDGQAVPVEFAGEGVWRGRQRRTLISYDHGLPRIKELQPPQESEREPVPTDLQQDTKDTLSALAQLMRQVQEGQTCENTARTYDGRRVLAVVAHTGGSDRLEPTRRSIFSGTALRCDFEGRTLAGFLIGQNTEEFRRPLRGSAWLATLSPGGPTLPVRITFETRWFGQATMYLTSATTSADAQTTRK